MFDIAKTAVGTKLVLLSCFLAVCLPVFPAQASPGVPALDKARYITLDEIHPGQKAYCLTVLGGNNIEKFDLEVLSVVRDIQPGRDAILVVGTDPRFKQFGPIRGCSGSPVYIEGRMAGALSGGWSYSKDALYLTTPIEDMLYVAPSADAGYLDTAHGPVSLGIDFSKPIDLAEIDGSEQARARSVREIGRFFGTLSQIITKPNRISWYGAKKRPVAPLPKSQRPQFKLKKKATNGRRTSTKKKQIKHKALKKKIIHRKKRRTR